MTLNSPGETHDPLIVLDKKPSVNTLYHGSVLGKRHVMDDGFWYSGPGKRGTSEIGNLFFRKVQY